MIDKKFIYLGSVFLFLVIIKFINPPIIQKISFIECIPENPQNGFLLSCCGSYHNFFISFS